MISEGILGCMKTHERIRKLLERGLTQEQIAEECNMNQSTVSRILSGALPKPNEELVLSVARLYSDVFFGAER